MATSTAAVAGAGIIGLATALTLADRGHRVTVHDPAPLTGATHHAGGMLAPTAEVVYKQDPLFPLMRAAGGWYPELVALAAKYSELPTGYRTNGTLVVARDRADKTHLDELKQYQAQHGMMAERLTTRAARALEPALSPTIAGAVRIDGDHQVQPRLFGRALFDACANAGVTFVREALADVNETDADQVVIAAGMGAKDIGGWFDGGNPLQLRPVYGDVLRLAVPPHQYPLVERVIRGFVEDRPVYVIPREDRTLTVGATSREDGRALPQVQGVHQLLRDAIEIVPGLEECDLLEATAGARPGTPDDLPYLGRVSDRVVVSTGYFRHGILLASLAARCVSEIVDKREPSVDLEACDPMRHRRNR
ncbi:glycine oxidase ThiO [Corynebacterium qintianiae]|uniref:glycine oxidase ThiO n=1 Tax=Corynebacterium qintianiae TaxID=2709392 RepID=UPI0013EBC31A|nr:glycine oxidase ThiO [Corynebacterium qintianiae]